MLFKKLLFIFAASGAITGTPADREFKLPAASSGESDSVKDFFCVLLAYPAAEPTGNALAGIHPECRE